jgi:hypothetical protein
MTVLKIEAIATADEAEGVIRALLKLSGAASKAVPGALDGLLERALATEQAAPVEAELFISPALPPGVEAEAEAQPGPETGAGCTVRVP